MSTFKADARYKHCEVPHCHKSVGDQAAKWSMNKYQKILCFDHAPRKISEAIEPFKQEACEKGR